jgi:5-methylcytosine-specific restriction enzyme B
MRILCHLSSDSKLDDLAQIFKQKIIPQLQEYFFDDWEKISLVLFNNGMIVENKKINISGLFPSNQDQEYFEQKKIWQLNEKAFKEIDSFRKILGHLPKAE